MNLENLSLESCRTLGGLFSIIFYNLELKNPQVPQIKDILSKYLYTQPTYALNELYDAGVPIHKILHPNDYQKP